MGRCTALDRRCLMPTGRPTLLSRLLSGSLRTRALVVLRYCYGHRVALGALCAALGSTPEQTMEAMLPDLMDGTVYLQGAEDGPGFRVRFPRG